MLIAYWQKKGLSFYRIKEGKITEITQQEASSAKFFLKRILVVSKELLFYTRRRYPPTPSGKLKKALKIEISELFPVSEPDFYIKLFESTEKATTVDIWAWQKEEYSNIRKIFPFQYVIPEDVLLIDEDSALKIFFSNEVYHLIAYLKGKFLGTLSIVHLTEREIELFLTGLLPHSQEIEKIKIYGEILPELKLEKQIERIPEPAYPLCLERIQKINLKEFKVKGYLPFNKDILFRIPLYALLAYTVFLFFTVQNYERALKNLQNKTKDIETKIASLEVKSRENYDSLISEVNKKVSETVSPLTLMNELAQKIPVGCIVKRFVLNEKNLEITMNYELPLDIIDIFESSRMVKSVKIKGAPVKSTGRSYDFTLTVELESE